MQVICINDNFSPELIAVIPNRPQQGKIYTIRSIFKVPIVEPCYAILLNEISNPPINHSSGLGTYEPSFNSRRFTDLLGNELNNEEVVKSLKEEKQLINQS